jgi:4-carboxymuconolactone decarboxylase
VDFDHGAGPHAVISVAGMAISRSRRQKMRLARTSAQVAAYYVVARMTHTRAHSARGIRIRRDYRMTDSTTTEPKAGPPVSDAASVRIVAVAPADRSPTQRRVLEPVGGDGAANVFATLVAHPKLLEAWLPFCRYLLRCPEFSARRREMVILRTAWLCGAHYEWAHHVGFARESGLSEDEIPALSDNIGVDWTAEERALLDAVDELCAHHTLSDATWNRLAAFLDTEQLIALPMLVGQYSLLAGTLNALGVAIDDDVATSQASLGWSQR